MAHVSPSLVHSLHFEDISHHCTVKSLVCVVLGVDLREPGLEWYVVLNVIFFYAAHLQSDDDRRTVTDAVWLRKGQL